MALAPPVNAVGIPAPAPVGDPVTIADKEFAINYSSRIRYSYESGAAVCASAAEMTDAETYKVALLSSTVGAGAAPPWFQVWAENLNQRLGEIEGRLGEIEGRLGHMDGRLGHIDEQLNTMNGDIQRIGLTTLSLKIDNIVASNRSCGDGMTHVYQVVPYIRNNELINPTVNPDNLPALVNVTKILKLTRAETAAYSACYGLAGIGRVSSTIKRQVAIARHIGCLCAIDD